MKKTMLALATAAAMAVGTLSVPTTADARCYGCAVGAGVAAGVIGGAIIGGAIANSQPRYYAPAPGYVVYEGYGAPYPAACPGGYWARRPLPTPSPDVRGSPARAAQTARRGRARGSRRAGGPADRAASPSCLGSRGRRAGDRAEG